MKYTRFEKDLMEAIRKGDYEEVKLTKAEREKFRMAARLSMAKSKSITLRINTGDLEELKNIAAKKGKKYQTYIGELLHEHVRRKKAA